MPCDMKVSDKIDRLEVINERLPLTHKQIDGYAERVWDNLQGGYPRYPKSMGKGLPAKTHRIDEVEEKSSGNKNLMEPAHNPTDINKCCLNEQNHLWKNCPNNSNSKNHNGTHYSKVREQEERADTVCLGSRFFLYFQFQCHKWYLIEKCGWELSSVQRWASSSQYWRSYDSLNF